MVVADFASPKMVNYTLTGSSAAVQAGGVASCSSAPAITNSIIYANTSLAGA